MAAAGLASQRAEARATAAVTRRTVGQIIESLLLDVGKSAKFACETSLLRSPEPHRAEVRGVRGLKKIIGCRQRRYRKERIPRLRGGKITP
jgi:hypothetical protein